MSAYRWQPRSLFGLVGEHRHSLQESAGRSRTSRTKVTYVKCRAAKEDFEYYADGPRDDIRPKFTRDSYGAPLGVPQGTSALDSAAAELASKQRWKRRGKIYKATPIQAFLGAVIGGISSFFLGRGVHATYSFLVEHPPVKDAPGGLNDDINGFLVAFVVGFGGLAVSMFSFISFGLLVLAVQKLQGQAGSSVPSTGSTKQHQNSQEQ